MEHGNGFKSTWFFAPFGGEYDRRVNDFDPVYHRKPSEITAMFRKIHEKGCELTLHGIRSAFLDAKVLKKQLESFEKRLGFKFLGVRHHYLMFRHGQTLEAASEAGLMYDTTLGFSDRAGFRNGMATPFFPFPVDHPAGGMVEIPLIFMDTVFTHSQDTEDQVKRQITESYLYAKAARGLFSVNIHPRNMNADEIPALDNFYHSLLSRFRSDQAHSMTGSELAHWWKTREKVLRALEYSPDMWRVKGVALPQNMEFSITAPAIKNMRFSIEGTSGSFRSEGESLTIHPGVVNPETGITIMKKTD
ncbi:MAG: hypothetical protein HOC71_01885, partial [Candidatus Latescibacteria bacterium]|nr:hypothetical protein [Candidatus Latescibacterota bacterium]